MSSETNHTKLPNQYVNFTFLKVDPAFRRLSEEEQAAGKEDFRKVIEEYSKVPKFMILTYSLVGLRADADFMIWRISYDIDIFQEMMTKLLHTGLGNYLTITYSYLSITKRSIYVDKIDPEHQNSRIYIVPGEKKYLFVYPFIKTRNWYQTSFPTRQGMMDEHIKMGQKYPSVKLNTTYSFGLDDQEFVVAFETNDPIDFSNLVQELRETEASLYTQRDTPMFTCIHKNTPAELLATL